MNVAKTHWGAYYDSAGNVLGVLASGAQGYTLLYVSGNSQSAAAGAAVTNPLIIEVLDRMGAIQTALPVSWSCIDTTVVLSGASSNTNVLGKAQITVTAGTNLGAVLIRAQVGQDFFDFTLTVTAGTTTVTISKSAGDNQSAAIDTPVAIDPAILLVDAVSGNPVPNQTISWDIVSGSGQVSAATSDTNSSGIASIGWTMGHVAGANTMTATLSGATGSPLTFSASGTSALATVLTLVSGDAQTPTAGSAGSDMVVKAADGGGTGIQSVTVLYTVTSGTGTLTGGGATASIVTGATGVTSAIKYTPPATLPNGITEAYTVTAAVTGLTGSPITFSGTGVAGTATKLTMVTQPPGNAQTGQALTGAPAVQLSDTNSNRKQTSSVNITVSIGSGSGSITGGTTTQATVNGVATFPGLIITGSGSIVLAFASSGLTGVNASAILMSPPVPDHLTNGTSPGNVTSGGTLSPSTVRIDDATGQLCTGTNSAVTAALVTESGSGSLTGTTSVNASSGIATFNTLVVTGAGVFHLLYTSGTLPSASSGSFTVSVAGVRPNEPVGYTRFAEQDCVSVPPSPSAIAGLDGVWSQQTGGSNIAVYTPVTDGSFIPSGKTKVWRIKYPTNQTIGSSSTKIFAWDNSTTSTATPYRSLYLSWWFRLYGAAGTDFHFGVTQIKPFGYLGYGLTSNVGNDLYWVLTSSPTGDKTSASLDTRQQNQVSRDIPGQVQITVGTWYLLELAATLNSGAGAADGTLKQWVTPYGGSANLWCNRTDMVWLTGGHLDGFYRWHWANIYGGGGSGSGGCRPEYYDIDNPYFSGIAQ